MILPGLNLAFLLGLTGLLLIYGEFIWVGKLIFGVVGSITLLIAVAALLKSNGIQHGLPFFIASLAGFAVEAFIRTWFMAGIAGMLLLGYGAFITGVSPAVLVPSTLVFGIVTVTLFEAAKRARRNKLSDIA